MSGGHWEDDGKTWVPDPAPARDGLEEVIKQATIGSHGDCEGCDRIAAAVRAWMNDRLGGTRIHRSDGLHDPKVPCCWHRGWKAAMKALGLDDPKAGA